MATTQAINGEINVGDYVIVVPNDDYGYLVGQVKDIDKFGTSEHETGNPGDDIHVDFTVFNYPPWQQNDFAEHFNELFDYDEYKGFTELPLDDVIIAPDAIINLTGIGDEKINDLVTDAEFAQRFCNQILQDFDVNPKEQLIERINNNYTDFVRSLLNFDTHELVEVSARIAAMQFAHRYMTAEHDFADVEIKYYLQFQNPLEVVADDWYYRNLDLNDFRYSMDLIYEVSDETIKEYPLMDEIDKFADYPVHNRYMGVDLTRFLGEIAEKVIVHYPNDWNIDKEHLQRAVISDNPEDRRLMWHVSSYGTHLNTERDTFVKDSGAFNTWVDYRANDPDMFGYVIEVTGKSGHIITGNVYEVGHYSDHARYVGKTALPLDSVTLTYSNDWGVNSGKTITVSRREYDDDRHRLMSKSGNVLSVRCNPADASRLQDILRGEHSRRMSYPIGSHEVHLRKLTEKIAEIRKPPEQEKVTMPKEKSAFDKALNRGKAKSEASKTQKASEPNKNLKNKEVIE